jgi:hypothetical protein
MSWPGYAWVALAAVLAVAALLACAGGTLPTPGIEDPRSPSAPEAPTMMISAASSPIPLEGSGPALVHHGHNHADAATP